MNTPPKPNRQLKNKLPIKKAHKKHINQTDLEVVKRKLVFDEVANNYPINIQQIR